MEQTIIGLSGRKLSGKTTAVNHVCRRYAAREPVVRSFAGPLKEVVIDLFTPLEWGLLIGDLDEERWKNKVTPCGKTIRELLQIVGTDWCRSLWPDVWTNAMAREVDRCGAGALVLIPDVRFPNEVRFIQERGGHVIRLLRAPLEDTHPSETALDEMGMNTDGLGVWKHRLPGQYSDTVITEPGFDAIIDNREMSIEEQNRAVDQVLDVCGWVKETGRAGV